MVISNIMDLANIEIKENFFITNFCNSSIINKGAFGIVLDTQNKIDKKRYAVKIIPFLIAKNNPKELLTLRIENKLKEVRCMKNLIHPNIIIYHSSWIEIGNKIISIIRDCRNFNDFIDQNQDNEYYSSLLSNSSDQCTLENEEYVMVNIFIQMELMTHSLRDYLRLHKVRNCHYIINEILQGVIYLHSKNIIHCDLKPENILLKVVDNKIVSIKIADFGLVINNKSIEACNFNYGTTTYKPITSDNIIIDDKFDIYSLGIIFFELFNYFSTDMERDKEIRLFKIKRNNDICLLNYMIHDKKDKRPCVRIIKHIFSY